MVDWHHASQGWACNSLEMLRLSACICCGRKEQAKTLSQEKLQSFSECE